MMLWVVFDFSQLVVQIWDLANHAHTKSNSLYKSNSDPSLSSSAPILTGPSLAAEMRSLEAMVAWLHEQLERLPAKPGVTNELYSVDFETSTAIPAFQVYTLVLCL
jgi:hypothetical protein